MHHEEDKNGLTGHVCFRELGESAVISDPICQKERVRGGQGSGAPD